MRGRRTIRGLLGLALTVLLNVGSAGAQAPAPTPAPPAPAVAPAPAAGPVAENPLPVLPGLENAVEFWKQVFTRYGANDVIFHDRQEPFKVYKVVSIEDSPVGRKAIKEEIESISQSEPGSDVRAQRGISERFSSGFLAAGEVARRSDEYFPDLQYHPPLALDELSVQRNVSLAALLKPSGISQSEFFQWNPAFSAKARDIPAGYRIKAPSDKLAVLNSAYQKLAGSGAAIVALSKSSIEWVMHHVAPGETLYRIARNYRVTVDAIQRANGLNGNRIAPGQQLKIPKKT